MLAAVFELARPLLYALDPEQAHELTLKSLEAASIRADRSPTIARLARDSVGPRVPQSARHRRGLRQGCARAGAVLGMGFGFAEIGTRHAAAAGGQSRPRVFRLIARSGADQPPRLQQRRPRRGAGAAAARRGRRASSAINVGANKDAADRAADYVAGIRRFYDVASYFTVNISSPNTPGLRDLQAPAALDELLARVLAARAEMMAAGQAQAADRRQARAGYRRGRPGAGRRGAGRAAASTASPCRIRRWRAPGCGETAWRRKPAACPGGRCFIAQPSCWRACIG